MNVRGRYLATSLALLALGAGYAWVQPAPAPPRSSPAAAGRPPAPAPPDPTARQILDRAAALGLDARQRAALEALAGRLEPESRTRQAEVDATVEDFTRWMNETEDGGRASLAEIQRRSAAVSELGAELREHRRRHAEAAAAILTEAQRTSLTRTISMTVTEADQ